MLVVQGKVVVVIGAGGAARALVFGALDKGARVIIVNRSLHRAEKLAEAAGEGASVASMEDLAKGKT